MNIVICSCEKSGASLLGGILNCHPDLSVHPESYLSGSVAPANTIRYLGATFDIYQEHGTGLLNLLHQNHTHDEVFIWLIRNPVVCVSCLSVCKEIPSIKGFDYWVSLNTILWYFLQSVKPEKQYFMKFEQMIMHKIMLVDLFKYLGLEFNDQYLDYGDFDQPVMSSKSFNSRKIDTEQIDPYSREQVPNIHDDWRMYKESNIIISMGYEQSILI